LGLSATQIGGMFLSSGGFETAQTENQNGQRRHDFLRRETKRKR
jgi:hypothetical protein